MSWAQITFSRFAISVCKELWGGDTIRAGAGLRRHQSPLPPRGPAGSPEPKHPEQDQGSFLTPLPRKAGAQHPARPAPKPWDGSDLLQPPGKAGRPSSAGARCPTAHSQRQSSPGCPPAQQQGTKHSGAS